MPDSRDPTPIFEDFDLLLPSGNLLSPLLPYSPGSFLDLPGESDGFAVECLDGNAALAQPCGDKGNLASVNEVSGPGSGGVDQRNGGPGLSNAEVQVPLTFDSLLELDLDPNQTSHPWDSQEAIACSAIPLASGGRATGPSGDSSEVILSTAPSDIFRFQDVQSPPDAAHIENSANVSSAPVPPDGTNELDFPDTAFLPGGHSCSGPLQGLPNVVPAAKRLLPKPSGRHAETRQGDNQQPPKPDIGPKRKRKRFSDEERDKVKRVRRLGSCLRCRVFKERCDENTPCGRCMKVASSQKIFKGPCYRVSLDDVHTFRAGDADHGQTRTVLPVMQWSPDKQIKMVHLQWPFKDSVVDSPVLEVECQKFAPRPNDILREEFVVNGLVKGIELPPYACRNTDATMESTMSFMNECQALLEDEIRNSITDNILSLGMAEAVRYRVTYKTPIIQRALRIQAGAMLNSKYLTPVAAADVFGLEVEGDTPHYFQKLPLPPVLTYQIQGIIGLVMLKDQAAIIKELKAKIFRQDNVRGWYEIFLTVFVLVSTLEFVYQVQQRYLKVKLGVSNGNFTRVSFATMTMLQEWEASARNLTQHFRCVVRGAVPFSLSWEEGSGNAQRAVLDKEAVIFMRKIKELLDGERRQDLEALREEGGKGHFEKPLMWVCELFMGD